MKNRFDDPNEEDVEYEPPIDGQICYDELLFKEEEPEEKEEVIEPIKGQFNIWDIFKKINNLSKKVLKIHNKSKKNKENNKKNINLDIKNEIEENSKEEKIVQENKVEPQNEEKNNDININQIEDENINKSQESSTNIKTKKTKIIPIDLEDDEEDVLEDDEIKIDFDDCQDDEEFEQKLKSMKSYQDFFKKNINKQNEEKVNKKEEILSNNNNNEDGRGIIQKNLEAVLHDSMIPYTEHVVMDRALPRVEDGLKPVQRRILYSMLELGLTPDKPYRKSARIVGDCMGKYHPHGDSSVYDAMVRMSQDFILRAPLVDGHGNFGSIDGDSAAAMRYTEARLTPLALELLRELDKNTVKWSLNFDDTLKEPDMLPGRFPNLLVNGSYGIAVGLATNIPPHNLGEVIDGIVAYIDDPDITLKEMMKIIKGPDFPTGGELICGDNLKTAYQTGKGKILIRSKMTIETVGDKQSIVITEIPYQVNKAALLQKIAELKETNKELLSGIADICDESDRNGMRAVIKLKKDVEAKPILNYLLKYTNLQVTFGINMVAIAGGKPKLMGLLEIISYYTAYQREIIIRRTKFDLDQAKDRAHIVEGLLVAIRNIDKVIKIIKTSSSVSEAKTRLREKFNLSEKQAQAILDMRLARLVNLEVYKLEEELKELRQKIAELTKILNSKKLQLSIVKKEMTEIKKKFNSERRSIELSEDDLEIKEVVDVTANQEFMVAITAGNTLKKINMKNYSMSKKTMKDGSSLFDIHTKLIKCKGKDTIIVFTNKGNALKLPVEMLEESKWHDKGVSLNKLDKNADLFEVPVELMAPANDNSNLVFFTKLGNVKVTAEKECIVSKSFYQVIKLTEDDELISVEKFNQKVNILMLTKNGMSLHYENKDIPVQGRIAGGVKGINLDEGDSVIFASQVSFSYVTVITNNGYAKKLPIKDLPISQRYRKGIKYVNYVGEGNSVVIAYVSDEQSVVDLGMKFKIIQPRRISNGDRLKKGDKILDGKFLGIYVYKD